MTVPDLRVFGAVQEEDGGERVLDVRLAEVEQVWEAAVRGWGFGGWDFRRLESIL